MCCVLCAVCVLFDVCCVLCAVCCVLCAEVHSVCRAVDVCAHARDGRGRRSSVALLSRASGQNWHTLSSAERASSIDSINIIFCNIANLSDESRVS